MRPSLYEHAGGAPALLRLSRAMNARCLADPELNHPFGHADLHPAHDERLAAYWGEVLGGPPTYTERHGGSQSEMVRMHSCEFPADWNRRFVDCFRLALDDAGLPDDAEFRAAMSSYMEWAVTDTGALDSPDDVPSGLVVPRWDWDGLVSPRPPAPRGRTPRRTASA